ncbi:MAG: LETM1-related biofilm-associated protein, partial [Flavobacteriaceae bacterium]
MNPSAPGWINKFGHIVQEPNMGFASYGDMYASLRASGFVYGIHIESPSFIVTDHALTEDEIAKINLLTALYFSFTFETGKNDFSQFVDTAFTFYTDLDIGQISLLNKILTGKKTEAQLEKLIDSRIQMGSNMINRALGNTLANSLLYVDILIFIAYLRGHASITEHAQLLEFVTISMAHEALHFKQANKSNEKLIQLLDSSLTYIDVHESGFEGPYRELLKDNFSPLELEYFMDIVSLAIWEDKQIEETELNFAVQIGCDLGKSEIQATESLMAVALFFEKNKEKVPHLRNDNLALQFYDSMSKNVGKLILRNSKRLQKELSESAELVTLLSKATVKNLSPKERKKVKKQLLDIFKSIPSLAIFLLPGGAILLPIFIQLVPKLLPSAF